MSEAGFFKIYAAIVRVLQGFTCLASLFLIVTNLIIAGAMFKSANDADEGIALLIRFYNALFGVLVILSFFDLRWIAANFYFLMTHFGLGMTEIFMGVMTLSASMSYRQMSFAAEQDQKWIDLMRLWSGWTFIAIGLVFASMGLLNMPQVSRERDVYKISKQSLFESHEKLMQAVDV